MLIGYARVSTENQDTAVQVAALKAAGCERIFREKASGGRWDRPELHRLMDQLRSGDVLVVWKLDRLSRSLRDVLTIMERVADANAGFHSLTEAIDTTTAAGRMMMQMVAALLSSKRPCSENGPRPDWMRPGERVESVGAGQSCRLNNSLRSEGWFQKAVRRLQMRRGYSRFIPLPFHGCWRALLSRYRRPRRTRNSKLERPNGRSHLQIEKLSGSFTPPEDSDSDGSSAGGRCR